VTPAQAEVTTPVAKPGKPTRVEIPVIAVDEKLHGVGLNPDGSMEMPAFGDAAWYEPGPRPGGAGPAVIVAHVRGPGGADVFSRLHELQPGDEVTVYRTDGASTFVVDGSEQVPKEDLPYDRIWIDTDASALRLITCGGKYDPKIGGFPDNTIIYAHLA
jgi:LPXTG-site transpeptidase (sortase) family protein